MPWYQHTSSGEILLEGPYAYTGTGTDQLLITPSTIHLTPPGQPRILGTSAMLTATSAKIDWSAPTTGGNVDYYAVLRDAVQITVVDNATLTYTDSAVPNDAAVHEFQVVAVNGGGQAASAIKRLQWSSSPGQVPSAPTALTRANRTDATIDLTVTETADSTVTKHTVYLRADAAGTTRTITFGGSATTFHVTGMTASTAYTAWVTRTNSHGESDPSPTNSFTTMTSGGGGAFTPPPPYMGVSNSSFNHGALETANTMRIFQIGSVDTAVAAGSQLVVLSADSGSNSIPNAGGASAASNLNNRMTVLSNQFPNVKFVYCNGNEITRPDKNTNWTQWGNTMQAMSQAVYSTTGGTRDHPNWELSFDWTQNEVNNNPSVIAQMKAVALPWVKTHATSSCYPPGRKSGTYTPYAQYLKKIVDTCADWGLPYLNCGEWGMPGDGNTRPAYAAYAAKYMWEYGQSKGVTWQSICYWDNQGSNADNRLQNDPANVQVSTSEAWKHWWLYDPDYGGTKPSTWPTAQAAGWGYVGP